MKGRSKPSGAKKHKAKAKGKKSRLVKKARMAGKPARRAAKSGARPSRKAPKKARSRAPKVQPGSSFVSEPLEQVTVTCANCGRQFTVVKLPGLSMEGMICQRCELGEIEFPEN